MNSSDFSEWLLSLTLQCSLLLYVTRALAGRASISETADRHVDCINMLFADGHVQTVANGIDAEVYRRMATRCE